MSIKYSDEFNFLKFYGKHTIKQALVEKKLIGSANIDEYFAMFLQGYIDEYEKSGVQYEKKDIQNILSETKKKIDHYDNYNIEYALADLFGRPLPPPYEIYRIHQELTEKQSDNGVGTATSSTSTNHKEDAQYLIENLFEEIDWIIQLQKTWHGQYNTPEAIQDLIELEKELENIKQEIFIFMPGQRDKDNEYFERHKENYSIIIEKLCTFIDRDYYAIFCFLKFFSEFEKLGSNWYDLDIWYGDRVNGTKPDAKWSTEYDNIVFAVVPTKNTEYFTQVSDSRKNGRLSLYNDETFVTRFGSLRNIHDRIKEIPNMPINELDSLDWWELLWGIDYYKILQYLMNRVRLFHTVEKLNEIISLKIEDYKINISFKLDKHKHLDIEYLNNEVHSAFQEMWGARQW